MNVDGKVEVQQMDFYVGVSTCVRQTRCEIMLPISEAEIFRFICSDSLCGSFIIPASLFAPDRTGKNNKHSLDPRGEADDREEEPVCVEVFKHALDGLAVDPERNAGSSQVQAAAHHIL